MVVAVELSRKSDFILSTCSANPRAFDERPLLKERRKKKVVKK
jgi:hypothetical protein